MSRRGRAEGPEGGRTAGAGGAPSLTVTMIARDEEGRIGRALDSVAWADELLVLDSGSRDATGAVARERGARVVETGWPGYGPQKQRALEAASGDWVLSLDADEVVSEELAAEIRRTLAGRPRVDGFEIPRRTRYLGRWLDRWGWHRERVLRLVRREKARFTPDAVHEALRVEGRIGRMEGALLHHSYRDVLHHVEKIREYADLKAGEKHRRGETVTLPGAVGHGAAAFLSGYLLRGRFLDGWRGLVFELMSGWAALLAYVRLWELGRAEVPDGPGDARATGPRPPGEPAVGEPAPEDPAPGARPAEGPATEGPATEGPARRRDPE